MALADRLTQARPQFTDRLSRLLCTLDERDANELSAALLDPSRPHTWIAQCITEEGLEVDGLPVTSDVVEKFRANKQKMEALRESR